MKSVGQIKVKKDGVDQAIGIKTRCQVVKNRMGPPLKTIDYDIYFESGIDNFGGWLNVMKQFKLVVQLVHGIHLQEQMAKKLNFYQKTLKRN